MPNSSTLAHKPMTVLQLLNWMHAMNATLRFDKSNELNRTKMLTLMANVPGRCSGRAVVVTER